MVIQEVLQIVYFQIIFLCYLLHQKIVQCECGNPIIIHVVLFIGSKNLLSVEKLEYVHHFYFFLNRGHNYPVWCVSESPIGTYLATGSRDFSARLWTIDREFPLMTYVGHSQDVDVSSIILYKFFLA